jgi:FdhD protein
MFRKLPCIKVDGEKCEKGQHEVIEEVPIALFVNGRHAMTAMMSPEQLEDFVTGYLYTEQIIKSIDEIESIRIEKNRMSVITKNLFKVLGPKKTPAVAGAHHISIPRNSRRSRLIIRSALPISGTR